MNWEIGTDMYTLMCIKWMTNKNLLFKKINKIKKKKKILSSERSQLRQAQREVRRHPDLFSRYERPGQGQPCLGKNSFTAAQPSLLQPISAATGEEKAPGEGQVNDHTEL